MKPHTWEEPAKRVLLGVCLRLADRTGIDHVILRMVFAIPVLLGLAGVIYVLGNSEMCGWMPEGEFWIVSGLVCLGALAVLVYLLCAVLLPREPRPPAQPR